MNRREFLATGGALGAFALLPGDDEGPVQAGLLRAGKITAPAAGPIDVAFLVSESSNVIDMCGPWEVFQDARIARCGPSMDRTKPFRLYTVAETKGPVRLTGGLQVIPDYCVDEAPQPNVIVVPAMQGSACVHEWLCHASTKTDVTMSVCTGAFQLARAGLLKGKAATTHHEFYDAFDQSFPDVELKRGVRFVEADDRIATAGGLTSGIDLALRVVVRYFGHQTAETTAEYLEYSGRGWVS
jgi:transcriptional regulator GlxA family with amidase domain